MGYYEWRTQSRRALDNAALDGIVRRHPNGSPCRATSEETCPIARAQRLLDEADMLDVDEGGRYDAKASYGVQSPVQERLAKLRVSAPVVLHWHGEYGLTRIEARKWLLEHVRGEYVNEDTGEPIKVERDAIKKVTSHSLHNAAHMKSVAIIPELVRRAIFIDEYPKSRDKKKYDSYRYFLVGLQIDGVDYTVKLVVGIKGGASYYDQNLTQMEKGNLLDAVSRVDDPDCAEIPLSAKYDTKLIALLQGAS